MLKRLRSTLCTRLWSVKFGITARVMCLALPPLIGTLGLSGVVLEQQRVQTEDLARVAKLSSLTTEIGAMVHELQKERGATSVVLSSGGSQFRPEMLVQRDLTTRQLRPITRRAAAAFAIADDGLAGKLAEAQAELDRLNDIRRRIDILSIPPKESFGYYTSTIARLLDVVLEEGVSARDPTAERTFLALFGLMQAKERAGQERAAGAQGFAAGRFSQPLYEKFRHPKDAEDSFLQIFNSYATDEQRAMLAVNLANPINAEVNRLRLVAVAGGQEGQLEDVSGATWFNAATRRIDLLRNIEIALAGKLEAAANAEAGRARTWFQVTLSSLLAATVAIGCFGFRIARGLARPVREMTAAMVSLAAGDNEVAVPYRDRSDEIGAMATAVEVFRTNARVRRERELQIAHMARHDALTNLPNRNAFQERIEQAMALARRGETAAVFCIDLDGFKAVNDTLGHFAGDQLLRVVAERLVSCVRETDIVARLGGDEFAIIQTGMERSDDARILADRVLQVVGEPLVVEGQRVKPDMSIGIAVAPLDGAHAEKLMKSADIALYRAKAEGGHSYRFFEAGMEARLQARRQLEADLHDAVQTNAFELYYQPLIDARTSSINGLEALLRWNHPTRGLISPGEFIPIAEELGLIVPLGKWVIHRACADAMTWPEPLPVAVNVSPIQFGDPDLVRTIVDALHHHGLEPSRLEIEITESVLLLDDSNTTAALHELRSKGIRISMDDFGTGYSSLSYLRSFPFDKIKIDRSFTSGLGVADDAEAIIRAITTLGGSLGMAITAEGVETPGQLAALKAHGCTQLQGYLFSPPKPASQIYAMLHGRGEAMLESAAA